MKSKKQKKTSSVKARKFVSAVMHDNNVEAAKHLEDILKRKAASRITDVLGR